MTESTARSKECGGKLALNMGAAGLRKDLKKQHSKRQEFVLSSSAPSLPGSPTLPPPYLPCPDFSLNEGQRDKLTRRDT